MDSNTVWNWIQANIRFIFTSIFIPILCSVIAASLFWKYSFRRGTTKIRFAPELEKSYDKEGVRYRIRLINTGKGDLFDVKYTVRISHRRPEARPQVVYMRLGQKSEAPIIYGRKEQNKRKKEVLCWTMRINPSEEFYRAFSSKEYPDSIRTKAENRTLTLEEIISTYKDSFVLTIYVFGTDSLTGTARMFTSPKYMPANIKEGKYKRANVYWNKYEKYVKYILTVDDSQ